MKRTFNLIALLLLVFAFMACNDASPDTPEAIAKRWCDLNGKVHSAKTDEERLKASQARKDFENEIETKYKDNVEMRDQVGREVEKCESASEGRN